MFQSLQITGDAIQVVPETMGEAMLVLVLIAPLTSKTAEGSFVPIPRLPDESNVALNVSLVIKPKFSLLQVPIIATSLPEAPPLIISPSPVDKVLPDKLAIAILFSLRFFYFEVCPARHSFNRTG